MKNIIKMSEILSEQKMKQMVENAGGQWVGIQKVPASLKRPDLVMFNHPRTHSTLVLRIDEFTEENLRKKLS